MDDPVHVKVARELVVGQPGFDEFRAAVPQRQQDRPSAPGRLLRTPTRSVMAP
jgi:hypothetical protein